jgi:hypothetical protein
MPSPFPGMDPYIESSGLFEDFHLVLAVSIFEQLADIAPKRYVVRAAKRDYIVLVEEEGKKEHQFLPDVILPDVTVSKGRSQKKSPPAQAGAALAELPTDDAPVTMRAFIEEEHREAFVEILENVPGQPLVTAIEILSPSNKRPNSEGRDIYLRKRQSLLLERVNLVEIDLLRQGEKMPMLDKYPNFLYTVLVAKSRKADRCQVWPAHFKKPIPAIPVPLLKSDADLPLQLQPLIDTIYRRARYDDNIDYSKPLSPALENGDADSLRQLLDAHKS